MAEAEKTPALLMSVTSGGQRLQFRRKAAFRIGRSAECEVSLQDTHVSRVHARCFPEGEQWWLEDLNSSNGSFVGQERVSRVPLHTGTEVRLGAQGLTLQFLVEPLPKPPPAPQRTGSTDASRYFGDLKEGDVAGEHTMFIRSTFAQIQQKQKRKFGGVIAGLAVLLVLLGAFGFYQYRKAQQQKQVAEQMFYTMKGLDLEIAGLQETVAASSNPQAQQQLRAIADRRAQMEDNYDHFLASMHVYSPKLSEQDRLIMRVARIFGECEVDMPKEFTAEVERYIRYWKTSGRWKSGMQYAQQQGYIAPIAHNLRQQGLPTQFMYIPMNEGNYHQDVSGPITKYGIPKGMWQFLPMAATHYGLHVGPLLDEQVPDDKDDRDHFDLESGAAAKYLKDLYSGDAQASGLLVLACYDMGEPRVVRMVRSMPSNPRERNFWKVLQAHRDQIPQETYDYVFRIFAAAVIGENPRLFGYDFDPPIPQPHPQG